MEPRTRNSELGIRNSKPRERGVSIIELIVFIVIVSAAVAGVVRVLSLSARSSADPVIHKQALAIAEAVLEEVQLQPFTYCDPDDPSAATVDEGGAPITFRSAASATGTGSSITINKPAGVIQNDVMVATIFARSDSDENANTFTPPSGWTSVRRTAQTGNGAIAMQTWTKVAGAAEPASYQWTFNSSTGGGVVGNIRAYIGVDLTAPLVDAENGGLNASSVSVTAPTITTTVANAMLVGSFGSRANVTFTPPGGMTERVDVSVSNVGLEVTDEVFAAPGATGTRVATATAAAVNIGHILALKPKSDCPTLAEGIGPEPGETRYSTTLPFDNVNDYHDFDSDTGALGIRNIDNTPIAGLDSYRVTVSVVGQPLGGIGNDANGSPQSLLTTVTVTGIGNTTVTLHGYRVRYAPNALP